MTPCRPVLASWWHRAPGFVVAAAALNRAEWLARHDHYGERITFAALWAAIFAFVGVAGLLWHLSAPWRADALVVPWVAIASVVAWGGYATTLVLELGLTNTRAVAADLVALAVLIGWTWGGTERLNP